MAIEITISLSDQAQAGWQAHLDEVVNPKRNEQNLLPFSLQEFFRDAEETAGIQQYVQRQRKTEIIAKLNAGEPLSQSELNVLARLQMKQ